MAIEDYLGYDQEPTSVGSISFPHPLSHGPDALCYGRRPGQPYEGKEVTIYTYSTEVFDGDEYCVRICEGCGKQWWEEYDAGNHGAPRMGRRGPING